jgi:hypothetical protein
MKEGEVLPISTFSCDIGRGYHEGTTTTRYESDGQEESKPLFVKKIEGNQHCAPEVHAQGQISDATYAVEIVSRVHGNGGVGTYVGRVIVWPGCNQVKLANVLAPYIYGEGADAEYPAALKDFAAAQKWLAKFEIEANPEKSDTLIVKKMRFNFTIGGACNPTVITRLVEKHGIRLLENYFGEEQKFFLRAQDDIKEAVKYVFSHYRVVAVSRGEKRYLKFALLATPDQLGHLDSDWLDGRSHDGPIAMLLRKHPGLKDLLFVQANEGIELVDTYPRLSFLIVKDGMWVGQTTQDTGKWHDITVATEANAISVYSFGDKLRNSMKCLSSEDRRIGAPGLSILAVMRDGDRAISNGMNVLLLVRPGETKNFIFSLNNAFCSPDNGSSVWGVTVRRSQDGSVYYTPYDNGVLYTCAGYWGGEVSAKPLIK